MTKNEWIKIILKNGHKFKMRHATDLTTENVMKQNTH